MAIAVTLKEGRKPKKQPEKKVKQVKRKGWSTPYGFVDFGEPVTYIEALNSAKEMHEFFSVDKGGKDA